VVLRQSANSRWVFALIAARSTEATTSQLQSEVSMRWVKTKYLAVSWFKSDMSVDVTLAMLREGVARSTWTAETSKTVSVAVGWRHEKKV